MDFVAATSKFRDDIAGEEFGITPRHIDIHIVLTKVPVQNGFKISQILYLI